MTDRIAVIGGGSGGKALAADMALQGKRVRLFEFPEFRANVEAIMRSGRLRAVGAVEGEAALDCVTCELAEAVSGAQVVMVCTQALAHERVARELVPLVSPEQFVVLNPGSTCGSLEFARVFREAGLEEWPVLAETSTLTYGCRASADRVEVLLKVARVTYGTLPGSVAPTVGPELEALFPGLVRAANVLEAGLNNANPVIHPPIALLNAARIENEGCRMLFYRDGVSPAVARCIRKLDRERMALLGALGYRALSDPEACMQQGYAESTDYFECYARGSVFGGIAAPDTLDHRFYHEDIGVGLVMFCSLGRLLDVPTPACEAFVRLGSVIHDRDYAAEGARTLASLGLGGLNVPELKQFLDTGRVPI
ncbi:MAG: NAD/NADP octopine/nopaline dehydrogenase family protein [Candidatus Brocadiae bacterium]|nr:NAD/NADP octopine/nopaline dehydrogenase family protein [Candidatus Brocadiia bacterium]